LYSFDLSNKTMTSTAPVTTYEDALEDVHTRFILNLPDSELQTADRIFFQLEQAWWFYEDWICDPHPEWVDLPRFSNLKPFALKLFEYSPLLPDVSRFQPMWNEFSLYKRKISNYGCILLSQDCTKFVLCRVWNGKSFTFPAGKINQGEDGMTAAARETYEETGFDASCKFGLTATYKEAEPQKITWQPMQEKDQLVVTEDSGKRRVSYVVAGVPEDFPFEPVSRKEVSLVKWCPLDDIPKPSYGVLPFVGPLRKWIKKYKKTNNRSSSVKSRDRSNQTPRTTPKRDRGSKTNTPRTTPNRTRTGSRGRIIQDDDDLVAAGLASAGEISGWSEEDMFQVNEKLIGRPVEYDGNPHVFAEQGFGGKDPHAFHVVGGSFLNSSEGIQSLALPPDRSKLQPLFRQKDDNSGETRDLTPFFSDEGATPWGDVMEAARDATPAHQGDVMEAARDATPAHQKQSRRKKNKNTKMKKAQEDHNVVALLGGGDQDDSVFLTDAEITAKSQASKTGVRQEELQLQYEQDMDYIRQWVARLPKPRPTSHFGEFKLDVDRIMAAVGPALKLPVKSAPQV
jgi:mRNA-decapping enzyme subunit 2